MIILALDLASTSGWACGASNARPQSGSIKFGRTSTPSRGVIFSDAQRWIWEMLRDNKPDVVVWEAPLKLRFDTPDKLKVPYGLPAIVEAAAYNLGIFKTREAEVHAVRKFFLGYMPHRDEAKHRTTERCRVLGYNPRDDNEADAIAIWHYQASFVDREIGANITPLFAKHFANNRE